MANPKKFLKYVTQFLSPKFNPERRGALQMLAAAPLAGKLKMGDALLGKQSIDPLNFYKTLMGRLTNSDEGSADIASQLHRDLWDNARNIVKSGEYGYQDAFDNASDRLHEYVADASSSDPRFADAPETWQKAIKAREALDVDPENEALQEVLDEAVNEHLDNMDESELFEQFGDEDAYQNYLDTEKLREIHNHLDTEVDRLYGTYKDLGHKKWEAARDELAERLGLPEFLEKAQGIGTAGIDEYTDFADIPDFEYMDPEALRYAQLRSMLEHPVLTPRQLMEVTGVDPSRAIAGITPEKIAESLYQNVVPFRGGVRMNPYETNLDLERVPESVREALGQHIDQQITKPDYGWEGKEWNRGLRDMRKRLSARDPIFERLEDVPSYINMQNPFRATLDKANRMRKFVKEPLPYVDVIRALPPEEYSDGGRVYG